MQKVSEGSQSIRTHFFFAVKRIVDANDEDLLGKVFISEGNFVNKAEVSQCPRVPDLHIDVRVSGKFENHLVKLVSEMLSLFFTPQYKL